MDSASARTCDEVQVRLIGGDELPEPLRLHLDGCSECRFLQTLSRNFEGALAAPDQAGPLGAPLHAALAAAVDSGEPILGRYRLKSLIGRGGYGEVYRTIDTETEEVVALKIVRVRAGADDRTAEEVRNARRIVHPNVCRVFHTERYGDLRLIVMEYVDGIPLDQRRGRGPRREALSLFRGIAEGVRAAHDAGVLHLDLKPRNVLLRDGRTPVVTDFGLSVRLLGGEGVSYASGGTPAYMAPEQRERDKVDRRTDVHALGLILRDLLGGHPGSLRGVIRRATARDPDRRHPDVGHLLRALDGRRRAVRWAIRIAAALAAVAVLLLLLALVVPPPHGPRAAWRQDLWGPDPVPADAWNVARNRSGQGRPRVIAGSRGFGCGQRPTDLLDGTAHYTNWEHGFAFQPVPEVCVSLEGLAPHGACGPTRPEARLCEIYHVAGERKFRALDRSVADLPPSATAPPGLGQLDGGVPCGERTLTVELDRPHQVLAVRAWHLHPMNHPRAFKVIAEDPSGARTLVFTTISAPVLGEEPARAGRSAALPQTAQFPPVTASKIDLIIDTCSMRDADGSAGHGWLYELEVFATLPRLQAWKRYLSGD